ncbi:MAG TPA: hypothetical protein VKW08_14005 [Xanthobacteraceae bacterium]|nr:hypothetical protein [Xanthobacteraceae bacterium]
MTLRTANVGVGHVDDGAIGGKEKTRGRQAPSGCARDGIAAARAQDAERVSGATNPTAAASSTPPTTAQITGARHVAGADDATRSPGATAAAGDISDSLCDARDHIAESAVKPAAKTAAAAGTGLISGYVSKSACVPGRTIAERTKAASETSGAATADNVSSFVHDTAKVAESTAAIWIAGNLVNLSSEPVSDTSYSTKSSARESAALLAAQAFSGELACEDAAAVCSARIGRLKAACFGMNKRDVLPLSRGVGRARRQHCGECGGSGEGANNDPDQHGCLLLIGDSSWCGHARLWFALIARSVTAITLIRLPY